MPRSKLRDKYTFKRGRLSKGYVEGNYYMGPTIFYNHNGTLHKAGSYDPNIPPGRFRRKIGLWKHYDENGGLIFEIIHIR